MRPWFTVDKIDPQTHIISEYRHWEETHCYLLEGSDRALLIDTGLGICDISVEVRKLTSKPVTAVATHIHWDHIGGTNTTPISTPMRRNCRGFRANFRLAWRPSVKWCSTAATRRRATT